MKPRKYRLRIRLHRKIYDLLEMEALWQDSKIGTLANRILQEELAKLRQYHIMELICVLKDLLSLVHAPHKLLCLTEYINLFLLRYHL